MRVIEKQLVEAIRAKKHFRSGNTSFDGNSDVRLYGNLIAVVQYDAKGEVSQVKWTLAGWPTVTTRSRINALARAFGCKGVYQEKHIQFLSGTKIVVGKHDWVLHHGLIV